MMSQQSILTSFAQGLARAKALEEAYVAAGYEPNEDAGQLAKEIDEAVEEITLRSGWGETRDVKPLIEDLKAAFDGAVRLDSAAGMAAARGLAAEAAKLKQLLPREPEPEDGRARRLNNLTEAEWIKLYGQPAP
jgi:hypothetical protein